MADVQALSLSREDRLRTVARKAFWRRFRLAFWQVGLVGLAVAIWEIGTRIPFLSKNFNVFDPFFVSRPSAIILRLYDWTFGAKAGFLWPHLEATLIATLIGLVLSVSTGFVVGLLFSQKRELAIVLNPFIVALNSLPRIAFVPLITMIFGLGLASKVVTAWFIVFFLVFFNTFKGGMAIEKELIEFCRTLGANERQITRSVRIPNALGWTFTALPNAVSFSLIGVVIAEFVGSTTGMGYLIITSLATLNSADMFAALTVLSLVGVVLVSLFKLLERRLMRWSPEFREQG
ncbi:MAG: ABC transporter permease [Rhizobiales bacterium 62-47]|nr:ABC transporter permease [Hyphomicrobiales bacterium]OJY08333.1 MAG: ABC transporter permease [Rhizobiales bacterium 62-47]